MVQHCLPFGDPHKDVQHMDEHAHLHKIIILYVVPLIHILRLIHNLSKPLLSFEFPRFFVLQSCSLYIYIYIYSDFFFIVHC